MLLQQMEINSSNEAGYWYCPSHGMELAGVGLRGCPCREDSARALLINGLVSRARPFQAGGPVLGVSVTIADDTAAGSQASSSLHPLKAQGSVSSSARRPLTTLRLSLPGCFAAGPAANGGVGTSERLSAPPYAVPDGTASALQLDSIPGTLSVPFAL